MSSRRARLLLRLAPAAIVYVTAPPYLLYLAIMHALMLDDVLTSVNGRFDVAVSGILWDPLAQRLNTRNVR